MCSQRQAQLCDLKAILAHLLYSLGDKNPSKYFNDNKNNNTFSSTNVINRSAAANEVFKSGPVH